MTRFIPEPVNQNRLQLMSTNSRARRNGGRPTAYALAEVMVAVAVVGFMFVSLYAGVSSSFTIMQVARENLRATQILVERMETIRLYNWDQVTNSAFIPRTFTNFYYPQGLSNGGGGIQYTGLISVTIKPPELTNSYASDMARVNVQIGWVSGRRTRLRDIETYVARHGLQNYVYNPTNSP